MKRKDTNAANRRGGQQRAIDYRDSPRYHGSQDNRIIGVQKVNVPWDQNYLTREQARARGLMDYYELAEFLGGYHERTVYKWSVRFKNFPQPKALAQGSRRDGTNLHPARVYHPGEVLGWHQEAVKHRFIQAPRKKNSDG